MATDETKDESAQSTSSTLGRYELGEAFEAPAFGALHVAKVVSGADAGRSVVVRVLDQAALAESDRERLSRAGFAAVEVRDPKIAAVLDFVADGGRLGIVSERLEGQWLHEVLARAATKGTECPPDVALRIALDLVAALRAATKHWNDIFGATSDDDDDERALRAMVHGGVTPDDVVVAAFGETMLCEVGVSGVAMANEALRDTVEALSHRAPEQLERLADERSDVFSVGVIAWELLAGRSLFGPSSVRGGGPALSIRSGSPIASVKRKLESGAIQRLDVLPRLKGRVSKALADVVARATDRESKRRFTSLADLAAALEALDDEVATHEEVATWAGAAKAAGRPDSFAPPSNRPTKPPADGAALEDRATKTPSIPDIPAPPADIASIAPGLLPRPPEADADELSFVERAKAVAARISEAPAARSEPPAEREAASDRGGAEPDARQSEPALDLEAPDSEPGLDLEAPDSVSPGAPTSDAEGSPGNEADAEPPASVSGDHAPTSEGRGGATTPTAEDTLDVAKAKGAEDTEQPAEAEDTEQPAEAEDTEQPAEAEDTEEVDADEVEPAPASERQAKRKAPPPVPKRAAAPARSELPSAAPIAAAPASAPPDAKKDETAGVPYGLVLGGAVVVAVAMFFWISGSGDTEDASAPGRVAAPAPAAEPSPVVRAAAPPAPMPPASDGGGAAAEPPAEPEPAASGEPEPGSEQQADQDEPLGAGEPAAAPRKRAAPKAAPSPKAFRPDVI